MVVGVLDPATGGLSPDVLTTEQDPLLALAKSPIDGKIWVITLGGTLLNADLAAHTYTPVHPLQGFPIVYGADFDRDGQLFVTYKAFDDGDFQWRLRDPGHGHRNRHRDRTAHRQRRHRGDHRVGQGGARR